METLVKITISKLHTLGTYLPPFCRMPCPSEYGDGSEAVDGTAVLADPCLKCSLQEKCEDLLRQTDSMTSQRHKSSIWNEKAFQMFLHIFSSV